jgi:phosphoesterase RecJ-like protein
MNEFEPLLAEGDLERLRQLIEESQSIVLTCHQNADGDALGSTLAMAWLLKSMGKEAQVFVPDQYPDFLMWLPGTQEVVRYDKHKEGCDFVLARRTDLLFCMDYNTLSRTADLQEALEQCPAKRILIDHHLAPDIRAEVCVSMPQASSTCELVFRLVWQLGLFPQTDRHFATCVYCGMMTDTGAFTYNSASPEIYFIIGQLLTKGIDKDRIYRNVFHNYSEQRLRLTGFVLLQKLVVMKDLHTAYYTLSKEDQQRFHFKKGDAEGLVNMPLQIKGVKLSISLREDTEKENTIWVSLRSVDSFPCNKMAEQYFNGGGHLNASGGRLYCTLAEATELTRKAIAEFTAHNS